MIRPLALYSSITGTAILAMLLSGCMVGPHYHTPAVPTPPAFKEANSSGNTAAASPQDWWTVFNDPVLTQLEEQTIDANPDIRIAVARVDQADAVRRAVRSYELPTVTADPVAGRTRESQTRPNNGNTNGQAATYNDLQLPLDLSYEIDAWGRIRRTVRAAAATEQATRDDLRFVRLSMTASLASSYFSLREADAELKIVQDTIVDLQKGYDITNNQFRRGLISNLAVEQAKTLVDQAKGRIEALNQQRAVSEHIIAILTGQPASTFSIAPTFQLGFPPIIPAGLPATILNRRPDIASAERSAAAASEQIGIAKAAYYPQISLTGAVGYESTNISGLLNWRNTLASLIASATAPVFLGGRLRANVDQADAAYRIAVINYERSVLIGYQEVEDQLSTNHYLVRQYTSSHDAVEDATRAEQIATNRYKVGLVSYLDVVFAQQARLTNEESMLQIQGQQALATVALIRALGGGW